MDQVYKVRDPEGNIREIRGPAGASDADVIAQAQRLFATKDYRALSKPEAVDPTADMSGFDKFFAGAGKAISDTGLGLKQIASHVVPGMDPEKVRQEVVDIRQRDKPLMDTGAGFAGNLAGNVGMAIAPGGALKGAGVVASALPGTAKVAQALNAAGSVLLAPKTIPSALAVGGGMGLIQPAESGAERVTNAMLGGVATAAVPAASRAWQAGKSALEPFYEAGRDKIIGRALQKAAGGEADNAMRAMQSAREIVPGSAPTAGQASGNAGIAALERAAEAAVPEATVPYAARRTAQNAARVAVLDDLAGTAGARNAADAARSGASRPLYEKAYSLGIDPAGVGVDKALLGELDSILATPAGKKAMEEARKLAANEGAEFGASQVKALDYMKRAMDDQIGAAAGNEQRILTGLKDRFLGVVDRLSPEYAQARQNFQAMSKPINQMDVAQEIADKSINRLTGNLQPNAYARALSDDTAARATGFGKATLENTLTPEQLAKLNAVKEDVKRAVMAQNAGRGVGSDTVQKLAYSNILDQSGLPTFFRSFAPAEIVGNAAARGADAVYSRANREIAQKLASGLLDPKEAARMMASATPSERAAIVEALISRTAAPLGMSAPALLNANQ